MLQRHPEPFGVVSDGLVEILDRHSYVVNASEHGAMSLGDTMSPKSRNAGRMPAEVINTMVNIARPTERRPDGGGLRVWFRREDEVEYYEGESPPG
jgi:hypothetical protein